MILKPCHYCQFSTQGCTIQDSHLEKIFSINGGGLQIRNIAVNCTKYWTQFTRGDRVEFSRHERHDEYFESGPNEGCLAETDYEEFWYTGTFVNWSRRKAIICLDVGFEGSKVREVIEGVESKLVKFLSIYPRNHKGGQEIKRIKGPRWHVCGYCGIVQEEEFEITLCPKCKVEWGDIIEISRSISAVAPDPW